MYIDHLSYAYQCQKRKTKLDVTRLKHNVIHKVALYKSDGSGFYAINYTFTLYPDHTYTIHTKNKYTNIHPNLVYNYKRIGFQGYLQLVKHGYFVCLANMNETLQYPFKLLDKKERLLKNTKTDVGVPITAHQLKLLTYSVPVHDVCGYILGQDELERILEYWNYVKIKPVSPKQVEGFRDIDDVLQWIEG